MPFPHDELLREFPSPVPTQTIFGLFCDTATDPVDATGSLSNTGCHVVPLFVVRNTPPVPTAAKIVYGSFSLTAKSAMRPPMFAGPIARQRSGFVLNTDAASGATAAQSGGALVTFVAVADGPSAGSRGGVVGCCGCCAKAVSAAKSRAAVSVLMGRDSTSWSR